MEESIKNQQTCFTPNKVINQEYYKGKDEARRIRACFHCAKPNHSYHGCRNATESEKENKTNLLKSKNFDMIKFDEPIKEMQAKYSKPYFNNTKTLNFKPPTIKDNQSLRGGLKIYLNQCLKNCLNLVVLYLQCRTKIV